MNNRTPRAFADIEIGDEIGPIVHVPTLAVVQRYASAVRMVDQRFLDPEIAREKGFSRPIVPGPLSATFLTQLLTDYFTGWRLRNLNLSFRIPVTHGDTLTCWGTVTEKSEQDGVAAVHCDMIAENSQGERAIVGTAILSKRR